MARRREMTDELHATPEPWIAVALTEPSRTYPGAMAMVYGPDGDAVAAVWGNLAEEGDAYKNAVLMAAAPKMAKALKRVLDMHLRVFRIEHLLAIQPEVAKVLQAAGVTP
jgi:hypothetical protein